MEEQSRNVPTAFIVMKCQMLLEESNCRADREVDPSLLSLSLLKVENIAIMVGIPTVSQPFWLHLVAT